jgi:hypothetical protein
MTDCRSVSSVEATIREVHRRGLAEPLNRKVIEPRRT